MGAMFARQASSLLGMNHTPVVRAVETSWKDASSAQRVMNFATVLMGADGSCPEANF
jgi:hypothetical protein